MTMPLQMCAVINAKCGAESVIFLLLGGDFLFGLSVSLYVKLTNSKVGNVSGIFFRIKDISIVFFLGRRL